VEKFLSSNRALRWQYDVFELNIGHGLFATGALCSNREVKATRWAEIGEALYEDWSTVSSSIKNEKG